MSQVARLTVTWLAVHVTTTRCAMIGRTAGERSHIEWRETKVVVQSVSVQWAGSVCDLDPLASSVTASFDTRSRTGQYWSNHRCRHLPQRSFSTPTRQNENENLRWSSTYRGVFRRVYAQLPRWVHNFVVMARTDKNLEFSLRYKNSKEQLIRVTDGSVMFDVRSLPSFFLGYLSKLIFSALRQIEFDIFAFAVERLKSLRKHEQMYKGADRFPWQLLRSYSWSCRVTTE